MRRRRPTLAEAVSEAKGARRDALVAVTDCLNAADPRAMVRRGLRRDGERISCGGVRLRLGDYGRVFVIGGGKASALMAEEAEAILGDWITEGRVVVPDFQRGLPRLSRVSFRGSTHPLPTRKGVLAVKWMLELVDGARSNDLVVCLISGGGSALMPLPATGVTVAQKSQVTRLLMRSGADIEEVNCVRKHLSGIKGGRLAEILRPARVLSLIVSDVVGDDLASVASGLTVPDPTTYLDAKRILVERGVWREAPAQVRSLIQSGVEGARPETPKPASAIFRKVDNVLVGSNRQTLRAAKRSLSGMGYEASILSASVAGDAIEFGRRLAELAVGARVRHGPTAIIAGGETTVKVTGAGRGGRNQEVVLSAATRIAGCEGVEVVAFGTDGIDGPTDAAGAVADSSTVRRGRALGMDAEDYLAESDSYSYFARLGDLIVTGPTGTNVNDVMIALVAGR